MALIDTIPITRVSVPRSLLGEPNGQLPDDWLRSPWPDRTSLPFRFFEPVSYAWQALEVAARRAGHILDATGVYRTFAQQRSLFLDRYEPVAYGDFMSTPIARRKIWDNDRNDTGHRYWVKKQLPSGGYPATAAEPGESNHGLGLAIDVAEDPDDSNATPVVAIDSSTLEWLRDNAHRFGFGLETRSEPWHWHWIGGDALPQLVVDELADVGVEIPDLSRYGFAVPAPTTSEEDDMTPEQAKKLDEIHAALLVDDAVMPGYPSIWTMVNQTRSAVVTLWDGFPGVIRDGAGSLARTIRSIAGKVGAKVG